MTGVMVTVFGVSLTEVKLQLIVTHTDSPFPPHDLFVWFWNQ